MELYRNRANSGVRAYESGTDFIRVQFQTGKPYHYTYETAGPRRVEKMKTLAAAGKGLSTYISQYVKDRYVH